MTVTRRLVHVFAAGFDAHVVRVERPLPRPAVGATPQVGEKVRPWLQQCLGGECTENVDHQDVCDRELVGRDALSAVEPTVELPEEQLGPALQCLTGLTDLPPLGLTKHSANIGISIESSAAILQRSTWASPATIPRELPRAGAPRLTARSCSRLAVVLAATHFDNAEEVAMTRQSSTSSSTAMGGVVGLLIALVPGS